jgi:RHS repeat-associated protein
LLATRSENAVVTNTFTWDSTSSVPTMLSDGEYEYVYGNSRVPLAQIHLSDNEVKYLHTDVNGSVTASTDVNGNSSGSVVYSPYGTTTDAPISHFGFAGEWTDKDTGHSYLRARWLDTSTGTFLSEDPLTQSTGQAFGYTAGNPLQQVDPLGLCSILAGDLANLGSDCYSFADTPAFQTITDSVAGFGDAASMGGTSAIRALYGLNNVVNTCSSSYSIGELTGTAASFVTPGGVAKVGETTAVRSVKNVFSSSFWKKSNSYPTVTYSRTQFPVIADNIYEAQRAGAPEVLTRLKNKSAENKNRRQAVKSLPSKPRSSGVSRDEYPFASTYEGGSGARVVYAPVAEQDAQGVLMRNFYRDNNIIDGVKFNVKVTK